MSEMPSADEDLTRIFDGARAELPAEIFVQQMERRMVQARAARVVARVIFVVVPLLAAAAILTPSIMRGSVATIDLAAQWVSELALALNSPAGWIGSLLLGAWTLRRSHVLER